MHRGTQEPGPAPGVTMRLVGLTLVLGTPVYAHGPGPPVAQYGRQDAVDGGARGTHRVGTGDEGDRATPVSQIETSPLSRSWKLHPKFGRTCLPACKRRRLTPETPQTPERPPPAPVLRSLPFSPVPRLGMMEERLGGGSGKDLYPLPWFLA